MAKKYTQLEVENILKEHGCKLSSEYKNSTTNIKVECSCGNIFYKALKIMNYKKYYMCNTCIKEIMTKKQIIPYEELKSKIESVGYELLTSIDDYNKASEKCRLRCDKGHEYEQIPYDLLKGYRCKTCATKDVMDKLRLPFNLVVEELNYLGFILLSDKYVNVDARINVKCKTCNHIFESSFKSLKNGTKCPECYKEIRKQNSIIPYEQRLEYVRSFGFDILTPKEEYVDGGQKVNLLCDRGHEYSASLHDFKTGNRCPRCRKSKGEVEVSRILDSLHIGYETQYRIKECKFYNCLPFDFYLPSYNLLIEYDGKQHYELESFGLDMWNFVDIKMRDTVKNIYCKNNNIELLRIPYWDFNKIEDIIKNKINNMS